MTQDLIAPDELVKMYQDELGFNEKEWAERPEYPFRENGGTISDTINFHGYFLSQLQQFVLEKYGLFIVIELNLTREMFFWQITNIVNHYEYPYWEDTKYFPTPSLALIDALKRVPELVKGEKP